MVSQATSVGKPMIVVTFNYRLNIFAFNCGEGAKNLALQDQRLALEWVSKNIVKFGGDPVSNIEPLKSRLCSCEIRTKSR